MNNKEEAEYHLSFSNQYYVAAQFGQEYAKGIWYMQWRDFEKATYYLEKVPQDNELAAYAKVIAYDQLENAPKSPIEKLIESSSKTLQSNTEEPKKKFCFLFWCW